MLHQSARRDAGVRILAQARDAAQIAETLLAEAKAAVRQRVMVDNRPVDRLLDREQRATHGLAWLATYVEAIRQLSAYAERMHDAGTLGEIEELIVQLGIGEYLAQIQGGIPMSQGEILRPVDFGLSALAVAERLARPLDGLMAGDAERRARLVELMRHHHDATVGECGLEDTLVAIREEMRKFADSEVKPHANDWHMTNSYIPLEVIAQMSELGVFGLTIGEDYGGLGLGKEVDVRRVGGIVARLYRRRLARHALRDRRRAHSRRRHRGAEAQVAARHRVRRGPADGGVHRAQLPAPIWRRSRRARCGTATSTRSTATRPGSPIRCAPTS